MLQLQKNLGLVFCKLFFPSKKYKSQGNYRRRGVLKMFLKNITPITYPFHHSMPSQLTWVSSRPVVNFQFEKDIPICLKREGLIIVYLFIYTFIS